MPAHATISSATIRGAPTVVVDTDANAYIFERTGGAWKRVTAVSTGGVGLDAEYTYHVHALPLGVLRYQSRPGYHRCDGKPALLFAELWEVTSFSGIRRGFRPQLDCYRTDDPPTLHVVVELPGLDPDSVRIAADGSALVVSGTRSRPSTPGARYHQMEIEYGPFERRLELGVPVDADDASTDYEHGMLRIELPLEQS